MVFPDSILKFFSMVYIDSLAFLGLYSARYLPGCRVMVSDVAKGLRLQTNVILLLSSRYMLPGPSEGRAMVTLPGCGISMVVVLDCATTPRIP